MINSITYCFSVFCEGTHNRLIAGLSPEWATRFALLKQDKKYTRLSIFFGDPSLIQSPAFKDENHSSGQFGDE